MRQVLLTLIVLTLCLPWAVAERPGVLGHAGVEPRARDLPELATLGESGVDVAEDAAIELVEANPAEEEANRPDPRLTPFKRVSRALQLNEEQRADWKELLRIRHETIAPLRGSLGEVRDEIKAFLGDPDADPAIGGDLMRDAQALRLAIRAGHRVYVEDFEALLDQEQARKLQGIRAAAKLQPLIPAFRKTGLVAPPKKR